MSLRAEIHNAFDELEPRSVGLEERVIAGAAGERRLPARRIFRLRAPLSLVAVFVVIAVVVGALMGPRLIADWRSFNTPPQPAAPQTPLQKLEARPLHLPTIRSASDCQSGPFGSSGDAGAGPLHMSGSSVEIDTSWGAYGHLFLYLDGPADGPILVRARDLINREPVVFVGQYARGPVAGTDVLSGQVVEQHVELVFDTVTPPYAWQIEAGFAKTLICTGWQIDGPGFTETFIW